MATKEKLVRMPEGRPRGRAGGRGEDQLQHPALRVPWHLVGFAAFKRHCSLFVTNSSVPKRFAKELAPFTINHTTVRFTLDNPLPAAPVRKIVKMRIRENEGKR